MLPLTTIGIMRVMPKAAPYVSDFVGALNQAMVRWEIGTDLRIAAFLAQIAHESAELSHLEENLRYSAEALQRVWPKRFAAQDALDCAGNPEKIANRVYSDRLGNGPPASGDGWHYRGRGLLQLTGRDNYRTCSIAIAGDADTLLLNPELLATAPYASESAGWYWKSRGLNELADRAAFEEITRRINGGVEGLASRFNYYQRAKAAFGLP